MRAARDDRISFRVAVPGRVGGGFGVEVEEVDVLRRRDPGEGFTHEQVEGVVADAGLEFAYREALEREVDTELAQVLLEEDADRFVLRVGGGVLEGDLQAVAQAGTLEVFACQIEIFREGAFGERPFEQIRDRTVARGRLAPVSLVDDLVVGEGVAQREAQIAIVERSDIEIHPDEQLLDAGGGEHRDVRVLPQLLELLEGDVERHVDGAGLQEQDAAGQIGHGAEYQAFDRGRRAPVVLETVEHHLDPGLPAGDGVGSRPGVVRPCELHRPGIVIGRVLLHQHRIEVGALRPDVPEQWHDPLDVDLEGQVVDNADGRIEILEFVHAAEEPVDVVATEPRAPPQREGEVLGRDGVAAVVDGSGSDVETVCVAVPSSFSIVSQDSMMPGTSSRVVRSVPSSVSSAAKRSHCQS